MKLIFKYKKLFGILFWTCILLIVFFSLVPNGPKMEMKIQKDSYQLDYFLHFSIYLSLSILYFLWKLNDDFKIKRPLVMYYLIGGLFLAISSEFIQQIIPNRTFNPMDLFYNVAGVFAGITLPLIILKRYSS